MSKADQATSTFVDPVPVRRVLRFTHLLDYDRYLCRVATRPCSGGAHV